MAEMLNKGRVRLARICPLVGDPVQEEFFIGSQTKFNQKLGHIETTASYTKEEDEECITKKSIKKDQIVGDNKMDFTEKEVSQKDSISTDSKQFPSQNSKNETTALNTDSRFFGLKKFNFDMETNKLMRIFFVDLIRLLFYSSKMLKKHGDLRIQDIPHLHSEDLTSHLNEIYEKHLKSAQFLAEKKRNSPFLGPIDMLTIFCKTFQKSLLMQLLLIFASNAMKLISSICIRNLIDAISSSPSTSQNELFLWASFIAITNIGFVSFMHHSNKINYSLFSKFRAVFMKSLYQKVSHLSAFTIKEASVGKLVSLVSCDLNTIEIKSYLVISLIFIPFGLLAVAIILYFRFGIFGVYGLLLMVCYIPIQLYLAELSSRRFAEKSRYVDKRVSLTSELVEGIRLIKMYAWEKAFKHSISTIRKLELQQIFSVQLITIIEHALSYSSGLLVAFFIFAIVNSYGDTKTLTTGNMFATLDLLQYTRQVMVAFAGYGLSGLLELRVVLQRMAEVVNIRPSTMKCVQGNNKFENLTLQNGQIKMKNFFAYWKGDEPILKDISLEIKQGECVAVLGKVGSGKSSLLSCILKEVPRFKGDFAFKGKVAYVEQEPYIFSGTVRYNIIFGKKFDEVFYDSVIDACNLSDDFIILDDGDQTQIGERGLTLSGGQKARISLARALYSQADIYILDDPLSAVDSKVAKSLFKGVIKSFLKGKTVVLVTHQVQFAKNTDKVIIMKDGMISSMGKYIELQGKVCELANQILMDESSKIINLRRTSLIEKTDALEKDIINTLNQQIIENSDQKIINECLSEFEEEESLEFSNFKQSEKSISEKVESYFSSPNKKEKSIFSQNSTQRPKGILSSSPIKKSHRKGVKSLHFQENQMQEMRKNENNFMSFIGFFSNKTDKEDDSIQEEIIIAEEKQPRDSPINLRSILNKNDGQKEEKEKEVIHVELALPESKDGLNAHQLILFKKCHKEIGRVSRLSLFIKDQLQLNEFEKNIKEKVGQEQNLNEQNVFVQKGKEQLILKEGTEVVDVSFSTYKKLIGSSKYSRLLPLMLLLFLSSEILIVIYAKTIGAYNNSANKEAIINTLGYITLSFVLNLITKYYILLKILNSSSAKIHEKAIQAILKAKISFYDITPTAGILNKLSTDLGVLDQNLLLTGMDTIEIMCNQVVLVVIVVAMNPYFLLVAVTEAILFYDLLKLSKKCIVQTKQTDLRNRSPVLSTFTSTIQGVLSIRIYDQTKEFQQKYDELSDNSLRCSFLYWFTSRAFGASVNLLSALGGIIGIFLLIASNTNRSDIGQSIVYFLTMSDTIQWGLRQLIQTDVAMSSGQRLLNMCEIEQEGDSLSEYDQKYILKKQLAIKKQITTCQDNVVLEEIETDFPTRGKVEFINTQMRYREGQDLVLNGLTFTIQPGMRVGCVGRTGAGKSSVIQALFRMTEIERDQNNPENIAIKIDNHNINKLGLHTLRSGISIIPQMPFLFSGTILQNLDPLNEHSIEEIEAVILDIELKEKIDQMTSGINTDMTNASELLSAGQKQLICLGRVILKKSKLLILDEPTANMDMQTDELIQQKIKDKFKNSTVITVAHRLNTIADYDMVIVMDKGRVVEQGSPYTLLNKERGVFQSMVNYTGPKNSKMIYKIAKNAFENKINQ